MKQPDTVLSRVYRSGLALQRSESLNQTYESVTREAVKIFGGLHGSIFLETGLGFERIYTTLPELKEVKPRKKGLLSRTSRTNLPLYSRNVHPHVRKMGIGGMLSVPLKDSDRIYGVLTVLVPQGKRIVPDVFIAANIYSVIASLAITKSIHYENIRKSLSQRDEFISLAAHELKTPLTVVKGYAQLIGNRAAAGKQAKAPWIDSLLRETSRTTMLIDELLQVSRIRRGTFTYEFTVCHLDEVLAQAVEISRFNFPDRSITVRNLPKTGDNRIRCDKNKLIQVFTNIISNAVKFSPEDKPVSVSSRKTGEGFVITFTDRGIGIDEKEQEQIFEEFYKGKEGYQGMGLGLYLVKNIVSAHKGKVKVKSKPGNGTSMTVILPANGKE